MDPRDYLFIAEELAGRNESNCLRSAVSRAYYAAFNVGRIWQEEQGFPFDKDGSAHGRVLGRFGNVSTELSIDVLEIEKYIRKLKKGRQLADYNMDLSENDRPNIENQSQVLSLIAEAKEAIRMIDELSSLPTEELTIIRQQIAEWDAEKNISTSS